MLNNGLSGMLTLMDVLLIGILLGSAADVADYKVAVIIPTALGFIPSAVITYVYPYFSMHINDKSWLLSNYKKLFAAMGIFNLLICIFLYFDAPFIIRIAFGQQYLNAVTMFRICTASYFFEGTFRTIAGNLLVSQRKLLFNFGVALCAGVLNIVCNYFLILYWGAVGAAITTLIITAFFGILATLYLLYTFKTKTAALE